MRTKCIVSPKNGGAKRKNENKTEELVSIILLSDSPGYRMKSYGAIPIIQIGRQRLIDIQIESIKKTFVNFEIILCVGFDAEKVYKYIRTRHKNLNIRIVENQLYHSSNSCESLRLSLNNIWNDKVLICDGNLIFEPITLKSIDISKSGTLIEEHAHDTLEIGLNIENNIAQHFSFGARHTWSEILFLNNYEYIENLKKILLSYDNKNRFIFEALNELVNMNFKIATNINSKQVIKINNIKTYHNIKEKS